MHPNDLTAQRKRIGILLKTARLKRNWTTLDMSKKSGLTRNTIYSIEWGEPVMLDSIIIYRDALKNQS